MRSRSFICLDCWIDAAAEQGSLTSITFSLTLYKDIYLGTILFLFLPLDSPKLSSWILWHFTIPHSTLHIPFTVPVCSAPSLFPTVDRSLIQLCFTIHFLASSKLPSHLPLQADPDPYHHKATELSSQSTNKNPFLVLPTVCWLLTFLLDSENLGFRKDLQGPPG